jgi:hypothetical protein
MDRRGFLMAVLGLAGAASWPTPGYAEPLRQITFRVEGMT